MSLAVSLLNIGKTKNKRDKRGKNMTKTQQLQQLKEQRTKLYNQYLEACKDGDPDTAWQELENTDSDIITLIMSTDWIAA